MWNVIVIKFSEYMQNLIQILDKGLVFLYIFFDEPRIPTDIQDRVYILTYSDVSEWQWVMIYVLDI